MPSAVGMCLPQGLAFDSNGELFVADTKNMRVLRFSSPLSVSSADRVFGQGPAGDDFTANDCSDGGAGDPPISAAGLCAPVAVAIDPSNNLYVADYYNNRVLHFLQPFGSASVNPTPISTPAGATPVA